MVSDIGLPGGISGIEVAKILRARVPQQRIMLITGFTQETISTSGALETGLELMIKPFGLNVLVHKVCSMLQPGSRAGETPARPR